MSLPKAVLEGAEQSPAPHAVRVTMQRLAEERPEDLARLSDDAELTPLGRTVVAVIGASRSLTRLLLSDRDAIAVLDRPAEPVEIDATDVDSLARSKHLELLRIAALDVSGLAGLHETVMALSDLADRTLAGALSIAGGGEGFAVIGMGKLGGNELNYASDVDVLFVTPKAPDEEHARRVLAVARRCYRVDANLRPDGRSGPLTRSVDGYRSYWRERAGAWELQALIKARAVAGDAEVGRGFAEAASEELWARTFDADELTQIRTMKARSESLIARRGLTGREIKRGPGGIRDIEFAVQLLQLVHGRNDPGIRQRSTLSALGQLSECGYVATDDAGTFAVAYRFLRTVEHRLQIVEEEQTHEVPSDTGPHRHLAMVLGFRDTPQSTASAAFDQTLRSFQAEVRAVHERLFFRPLLEAFASLDVPSVPAGERVMDEGAVAERLEAFGFADVARTRAAVRDLAGGLTRRSRLMEQLLALLLDWLSLTPDPDLGLVALRNLAVQRHHSALMVATFRDSPEAARRLCVLSGTSRVLAQAVSHNPELIGALGEEEALEPASREVLVDEALARTKQRPSEQEQRSQLVRMREDNLVKIATRDLLEVDDVRETGVALSALAEALLEGCLSAVDPDIPFCVVGMGRLGGAELSYASDLDVIFVYGDDARAGSGTRAKGEAVAEALLGFVRGASPALAVATLDLGLRPEGGPGRLARDLRGYSAYFSRWAQTWERQAMLRARVVAGDRELGERFTAMTASFIWDRQLSDREVAEIRRMKARIERERIPAREDAQFHLKLGRGSLSDVEWTVQLAQLRNRVAGTSTMGTLEELVTKGVVAAEDAEGLRDAYRFCERTRNRWYLVGAPPGGGSPGDALPVERHQMSRLARSLETTPADLRDEYRRVTRRARRIVERLFYGLDT